MWHLHFKPVDSISRKHLLVPLRLYSLIELTEWTKLCTYDHNNVIVGISFAACTATWWDTAMMGTLKDMSLRAIALEPTYSERNSHRWAGAISCTVTTIITIVSCCFCVAQHPTDNVSVFAGPEVWIFAADWLAVVVNISAIGARIGVLKRYATVTYTCTCT